MTQSLEGSNTKIAKQSTFPIKASLILSQKACFVSPVNRVVAPNFGCQMTVLLRKTFFLQACLRNLLFHKVLKKIFAGVNRHQGTLKVQGPWSFLWLNLIKVSLNLIRTTQWIIVNPKFIQTFSTARNAGRTNAVAACGYPHSGCLYTSPQFTLRITRTFGGCGKTYKVRHAGSRTPGCAFSEDSKLCAHGTAIFEVWWQPKTHVCEQKNVTSCRFL